MDPECGCPHEAVPWVLCRAKQAQQAGACIAPGLSGGSGDSTFHIRGYWSWQPDVVVLPAGKTLRVSREGEPAQGQSSDHEAHVKGLPPRGRHVYWYYSLEGRHQAQKGRWQQPR